MISRIIIFLSLISFSVTMHSFTEKKKLRNLKTLCYNSVLTRKCADDFSCKMYNLDLTNTCDQQFSNINDHEYFFTCTDRVENYCLSKDNIENFKSGDGKNKKIRITNSLCIKLGEAYCKDNFYTFKRFEFTKNIKSFIDKNKK